MAFNDELLRFILDYHPELTTNKRELQSFIDNRVEIAGKEWEKAIKGGIHPSIAEQMAKDTLYDGLEFAPIEVLSYLAEEMECNPSWDKMMEIYPKVKHIIAKYDTTNDTFINDEDGAFTKLKTELKTHISHYGLFEKTAPAR